MTPSDARLLLAPLYARHPEGFMAFACVRDAAGAVVDFQCLYANPVAARALGVADDEVAGRWLLRDLPGRCNSRRFAMYLQVVQRGEASRCEWMDPQPGGERWFSSLVVPWEDGVAATFSDVSERKRLEAERDAAVAHFRTLTEAIPQIVWTAGSDGSVEHHNTQWTGYAKQERAESRGWGWTQMLHPEDAPAYLESWRTAVATGAPFEGEVRFRRASDGSYRWHLARAVVQRDPQGQVVRWVGTLTDVHDQRELLEQQRLLTGILEESEERFRSTFEQAAVGMAHAAPDGRLLRVNQRLCDLLGHGREELLRHTFQELTHPDDLGKDLRLRREALAGQRQSYSLEKRGLRKDGSALWLNLTATLVRGPGGAPDYFLCVLEDIGARRALEQERDQLLGREYAQRLRAEQLVEQRSRELAAAQAQLAQAEKLAMAGQLAAGVAHEVNNPLAFVLSNLGFVLEDLTELSHSLGSRRFDELLQSVREAREGAERIRAIVRDLKSFARPDTDVLQVLSLREAVEFAASMAAHELRPRAQLRLDCPPELHVRGHKTKLGQVLLNLLLNAAQATPEGNAAAHCVQVTARREGELACLEVRDSGRGIAPEHLTRIFEPFFTTRPVGEGSGLGLSVCHGIVQGMGGRIEVQSGLGEGTTVRVLLPLAPELAEVEAAPTRPALTRCGRLLVVDDEAGVGRALQRSLGAHHEVSVVRSGREALQRLAADPHFDAILCDVVMPELSGPDVYAQLAERHPQLLERLILMTGGAFTPRAREFLAQAPCPVLEKPFTTDRVLELLEERLGRRPARAAETPGARAG